MNTFDRGLGRTASALVLALVAAACFAAAASATSVNLRIEGPAGTVFNGPVNTGARDVNTTASTTCVNDGGTVHAAFATPATALADWADAQSPAVPYDNRYAGTFVCQIGADVGGNSAYWLLKINNKAAPPPVGYVTAGDQLQDGDSVLLYWTDDFTKKTLDLSLPANATVGVPISGSVTKWDGSDDSKTGAAGAAVASTGGVSATADSSGAFSVSFPAAGTYLVNATQGNAIRGSAVVTVGTDPVVPPALVHVNRFVKCNDAYSKHSRQHRRCVRIVRAKQAAAKPKS